eukprot:CAMPEP_0119039602 /NCGR_PEP_ID=MMETSP1177-20130426/9179_1 /TAXON_ID=2985 /ORGANISM="Ochromonas sp, Strain CCMP1899" /LENGTH=87 /DNA_ID=CAMNT_0007003687 /DNA_START=113 /DNA_END=376 /DNA_ORIENTATION=+
MSSTQDESTAPNEGSNEGMDSYMSELAKQEDLSICPICNAAGARRPDCRNAVVNRKDKLQPYSQENLMLVCCCLGDETKDLAPTGEQ